MEKPNGEEINFSRAVHGSVEEVSKAFDKDTPLILKKQPDITPSRDLGWITKNTLFNRVSDKVAKVKMEVVRWYKMKKRLHEINSTGDGVIEESMTFRGRVSGRAEIYEFMPAESYQPYRMKTASERVKIKTIPRKHAVKACKFQEEKKKVDILNDRGDAPARRKIRIHH